ncbi:BTAD domain-containing putative transcriptional regulator [Streptomyces sp. NPDC051771]|uniref:BTAD domain-containing putative transcriptional regulator n=1 Tax=Streptomyces sp. NPDC051771 TaxID=3154847 RepID=UPI003427F4BE
MEFRILGPLEVVADAEPLGLGSPRQRVLLGLLLIRAGMVVSYDRLAEDLWDGEPPDTARHTVQAYVYRLRRVLGEEAWRLESRPPGCLLKVSGGELDAQRFQDLADDGRRSLVRGDAPAAAALLGTALGQWRGPLLMDLDDVDALRPERARLEALRLTAQEDRIEADLALGRHSAVAGEVEALLSAQPFRERLWGQLMLALYRSGRQADALAAFRRARRTLREELGIDPSRWLTRRQEQILLRDAALDAPETVRAPATAHNLPVQRSTFVGREREIADVQGLLRTRRLVCITGPPGSGKTRLALEAVAALTEDFPHGVCFTSLEETSEPDLVPSAISAALGVPEPADLPTDQALVDHLRSRRLLLLLDNVEHLLPAAPLVGRLLDAAPGLTVLATGRAPLRLSGEQEYPLGPLPLPARGAPHADLIRDEALILFADRAAMVDPGFRLGADNSGTAAEVVVRLDGLPLAIELAAARLRMFSLEELRRRLDPALPLLTGGPVDHAARQRTLGAAIAWSDDLLSPAASALLRRLGVFRGGVTYEAAEAVTGGAPAGDEAAEDGPEELDALVEASLLGRAGKRPDESRFAMLETVREYALERLRAAGEEKTVRDRHARYYADFLEHAEPELTGPEQARWLERLDTEYANLQSALSWARGSGDTELALLMAARMWRFWQLRGRFGEGRHHLEKLLAPGEPASVPRTKALIGLAGICYWQFDLDASEAAYHRARDMAVELDDWWLELEALTGLVTTLTCHRGDLREAAPLERKYQELTEAHPEPFAIGLGLATSMVMRLFAGDLEGCRFYGEQCLEGTRALGLRWYESQVLRTLGLASLLQDRFEQAEGEIGECLGIAAELGDVAGAALDLDRLGQAAVALGRPKEAVVLAGTADRLRESAGGGLTVQAFRWEREHPRDAARRFLTEDEIDLAWARGRSLSLADALDHIGRIRRERQRGAAGR